MLAQRIQAWRKDKTSFLDLSGLKLNKWPTGVKKVEVKKLKMNNTTGLSAIPKLTNCTHIIATESGLTKLAAQPKLQYLDISYNKLKQLPGLTKTQVIIAKHNQISVIRKTFNQAVIIDLSHNNLSGELNIRISAKLRVLLLHKCNLTTVKIQGATLKNLIYFSYFGNKNEDDIVALMKSKNEQLIIIESEDKIPADIYSIEALNQKFDKMKEELKEERSLSRGRVDKLRTLGTGQERGISKKQINTIPIESYIIDQDKLWDQVPQEFGPIKMVPLDTIVDSFSMSEAKIEKANPREKEILADDAYEVVEIKLEDEDIKDYDRDYLFETLDNLSNFMNIFDLNRIKSTTNQYKADDIRRLAQMAGVSYSDYHETIKTLVRVYIRNQNRELDSLSNEEVEIIRRYVKPFSKDTNSRKVVKEWYNSQKK